MAHIIWSSYKPGTNRSQTGFPFSMRQESSESAPNQNIWFPFTGTCVSPIFSSQIQAWNAFLIEKLLLSDCDGLINRLSRTVPLPTYPGSDCFEHKFIIFHIHFILWHTVWRIVYTDHKFMNLNIIINEFYFACACFFGVICSFEFETKFLIDFYWFECTKCWT